MKKGLFCLFSALLVGAGAIAQGAMDELTETTWDDPDGGVFAYRLTDAGAVVTGYKVAKPQDTPAVIRVPDRLGGRPVAGVGNNAFNNWDSAYDGDLVEALILPDTVLFVEDYAFQCCHSVAGIHFPASIERIPEGCFSHVSAQIIMHPDNPYYVVKDGFLIDARSDTLLYWSPHVEPVPPLPAVRRIGASALDNYTWCALNDDVPPDDTVLLPDGLESIGACAFYDSPWLERLVIPDSVTRLDAYVIFATGLTELTLSASLTEIPDYCCCGSPELTEIIIPPLVQSIGAYAFYETSITQVTLPESVAFVGFCAFPEEAVITCLNPDVRFETETEYVLRVNADEAWE